MLTPDGVGESLPESGGNALVAFAGLNYSLTTRADQLISAVQQSRFPHFDSLIHLFAAVANSMARR